MTLQTIPGDAQLYVPFAPFITTNALAFATIGPLDAAGETLHAIGCIFWADRSGSAKTVSSAGGALQWLPGSAVTFANAGTTLNVGLQTVDAANGPPGRASSSTPAVYRALVGGTDTITAATWRTDTFTTGTISLTHGDTVAIVLNMSARGGADTVGVRALGPSVNFPGTTLETSGPTYTAQNATLTCVVVADDGTLGWLRGGFIANSFSSNTINNGSAVKEYANIFQLPVPCKVDGIVLNVSLASGSADFELNIYSDPLNVGAGVTSMGSIAVDANMLGSSNQRWFFAPFSAQIELAANTNYAMAVRPTTANNIAAYWYSVNATANHVANGLDSNTYMASRGTVGSTTAFASVASGVRRLLMALSISALDDGAGGGVSMARVRGGH